MRLAEKVMANTFHCQKADCSDWAVVEDNVFVFHCLSTDQLPHLPGHSRQFRQLQFQDRVNADADDDAKRTKEMIDVIYLYRTVFALR